MGRENTIVTGNASVNDLGFNAPTVPSFIPAGDTTVYGRVVLVRNDRSIEYELIQNNLSPSAASDKKVKTGTAKPLYPYKVRLPIINEIVPLMKGPNTSVTNKKGMYDNTLYYLDPIGMFGTVNDNQAIQNASTPSNGVNSKSLSVIDIKKNKLGF